MSQGSKWRARILAVDDSSANTGILKRLLEKDYQVIEANSGEEALRQAFGRQPPDLVLLDIVMPGMDGYDVCRIIKNNPGTADIPIMFVTAKSTIDDEAFGLKIGAVDYISKPYQAAIIRARISNQLELLQARRAAEDAHNRLSRELEAMNDLQRSILPTGEFRFNSLSAQGIYIPSGLSSGDYFDYQLVNNDRLRCVVADVSGHGARAAFIMAMVRTVFHFEHSISLSPAEVVSSLNRQLMRALGEEGDFITLFLADVYPETGRIEYVSAGHCPAFFMDEKGFREIESTGTILGFFDAEFKSKTLATRGNWKLLIYTDGLYECVVDGLEVFGYEPFRDMCSVLLKEDAFQVESLPGMVNEAARGKVNIDDDQTALYIELNQ